MSVQNLANTSDLYNNVQHQAKSESSPMMNLVQMIFGTWISQSIYVVASLGIADILKDGTKSISELAKLTDAKESKLYRVLRTLASVGIFRETAPRQFALTEMGEYLRSDIPGSLRSVSMMLSDEWHWRSWGEILHVVKTGQPALEHVYKVKNTFEYLTKHPESEKIYNDAMTGWSKNIHTAVVEAYDFNNINCVVDIAGGQGMLITSILKANPHLTGILFDRPNVVAQSKNLLEKSQVSDRCKVVGGDFFVSIPSGSDAYIMSHIIHDWGDEDCIRMLKNIREVILSNGRLLVVDMVIPDGDTAHLSKWMDIDVMIMYSDGRERTEEEFRNLFQAAGFKLTQILPTTTPVSLIEGIPI
ncbi:MAG: methyltransferase [Cyanobacteriota bacterium]|nr:methyltransferase [Cyanobacteriota bacterium]